MEIILAVATGLYLFLFSVTMLSIAAKDRRRVESRLQELGKKEVELDRPVQIKRERKHRTPALQALANDLVSSGIRMRPEEYLVVWGITATLPALLISLMKFHFITVIAAVIIGAALPPYFVSRQKAKRLIKFESQLSEALVMAGNALRSGLTFQQAMANIANEMPDPIGKEFSRVVREINLGSSVDIALGNLAERVDSIDLSLAVSAIQIQRQIGGNLLDLLSNISETIKDRIKIKNEIRVLTATGRSSGMVIGILPIALAGILMIINPTFIQAFFETRMGIMMVIVGLSMETIGFLMIRKVVTIKY